MGLIDRLTLRARIVGGTGLCLLLFASAYTLAKGTTRQLVLSDSRSIEQSLPVDLWFTPNGALISLHNEGRRVLLKKWQPNDFKSQPSEVPLSFAEKIGVDPRYSLRVDYASSPSKWIPYTISSDAKKVAWWWGGSLYVQDIDPQSEGDYKTRPIALGNTRLVEGISFSGESKISILYSSGKLEIWNFDGQKERFGSAFDGKWQIWTQGLRVALSSFDNQTGDVAIVTSPPTAKSAIIIQPGFLNGAALALSRKGRLAVGTNDGHVISYASEQNVPLESSRTINSMVFYDERQVLVGGDFPGIFLVNIESPEAPVRLTPSPGVRLLALSKEYLAYSTLGSTVVSKIHQNRTWTPSARILWKCVLAVIALLGFTLAVIRDQRI